MGEMGGGWVGGAWGREYMGEMGGGSVGGEGRCLGELGPGAVALLRGASGRRRGVPGRGPYYLQGEGRQNQ